MKQRTLLALLAGCFSLPVFSQNITITGTLNDAAGAPVEAATVSLLHAADSSLVKVELSDAAGKFEFSEIKPGSFLLGVTALGYEKLVGNPVQANEPGQTLSLPPLVLAAGSIGLQEVTVTAQRSFIERRADRTIVNVESSILATGSTALEILERAPGVVVSQNDAISVRGRSGVIVKIGRAHV